MALYSLKVIQLLLIVLLSVALQIQSVIAERFYVKPTEGTDCECFKEPCYTIDYYSLNASVFSNKFEITLDFLCGGHLLTNNLFIANTTIVTLTSESHNATLNIFGQVTLNMLQIDNLTMSNLSLLYSGNILNNDQKFICESVFFVIKTQNVKTININNISTTCTEIYVTDVNAVQLYNSQFFFGEFNTNNTGRACVFYISNCRFVEHTVSTTLSSPNMSQQVSFHGVVSDFF